MKQLDITTTLDLLGLGLVSAGVGLGLWQFIGGFSLLAAGLVLIVGSFLASRKG